MSFYPTPSQLENLVHTTDDESWELLFDRAFQMLHGDHIEVPASVILTFEPTEQQLIDATVSLFEDGTLTEEDFS